MAYDSSNESREVLGEVEKGARGDKIIISKITNTKTGNESIDIRLFYLNKDGELAPTSKGIRFSTEVTDEVIAALQKVVVTTDAEEGTEG